MSEENEKTIISPVRILIVDNDKDLARTMTESLERVGFECTCATSGVEGVERIEGHNFDIIVTDLMMNDVDGMEILKKAKETQEHCEIIMVTGHASVPRAVEAMREGAYNFLEKPITPKRLQVAAAKAAESVQLKKQNLQLRSRLDERFGFEKLIYSCLLYTSPSPRDRTRSRMPSSA